MRESKISRDLGAREKWGIEKKLNFAENLLRHTVDHKHGVCVDLKLADVGFLGRPDCLNGRSDLGHVVRGPHAVLDRCRDVQGMIVVEPNAYASLRAWNTEREKEK